MPPVKTVHIPENPLFDNGFPAALSAVNGFSTGN
jgi:hypothetical protein